MNFSESALQKLMTSFPELGKLVVSFRDMKGEMDQESTTEVGVFVIRAGSGTYYLPVVSQSGTVYPIDNIFDAGSDKFFPLTKDFVQNIINSQNSSMGAASKTPANVVKNPSVRELVEPPKTGKYVYASSGRLPEFLSTLPAGLRASLLEKIAGEVQIMKDLKKIYDLSDIVEPLSKAASEVPVVPAESSAEVCVLTDGDDLEDDEVQAILNQGYAIRGEQANPRVAILSDPHSYAEGFTHAGAIVPGRGYELVLKNGTTKEGIAPPRMARQGKDRPSGYSTKDSAPIVLFSDGSYCVLDSYSLRSAPAGQPVITTREVDYKRVLSDLLDYKASLPITEVESGKKYFLFDKSTLLGVYYINQVIVSDAFMSLDVRSDCGRGPGQIQVNKVGQGSAFYEGNTLVVNKEVIAIPAGTCQLSDRLETNIQSACARKEFMHCQVLDTAMNLGYDGDRYYVDSKPVGDKVSTLRILITKKNIMPSAAEEFVKKAESKGIARVFMAKQAMYGKGSTPAQVPEYGEKLAPDPSGTGDRYDRAKGKAVSSLKTALQTQDKQVVDATLISELLQDPDLYDTIDSYLPDIAEAIDKVGRILLVTRLKSDDLGEKMNAKGLTELLTSLRNVYRILGDNYVKLERLSSNASQDS